MDENSALHNENSVQARNVPRHFGKWALCQVE